MIRKELLNVLSKEKQTVSFFEDDSIETVREQVAKSANSHPDRMFILVALKLPKDYYTADPRNWEALFDRLSYNGRTIEKSVFDEYQTNYRVPGTRLTYVSYDRAEWMEYPPELKPWFATECTEYRIFGVPDLKSFVLPIYAESTLLPRISSESLPRPDNSILVSSFYTTADIDHFAYKIYEDNESSAMYYFPYLRSETPNILSEEAIRLLDKNAKLLTDLLDLSIPKESKHSETHILHTRFYIRWVETDFGNAIRTRFEQIFYGMTVSATVPYIGLFTSNLEVNRHKFFTENPTTEEPYIDMKNWNTWWSISKPHRNIPTLILYRGKSKKHFDRVIVTAIDMTVSTNRPEDNTETPEELKKSVMSWIRNFDALTPFVSEKDMHPDRWELQDMTIFLSYPKTVDGLSTVRFNCVTPIYAIPDTSKPAFTLLRANRSKFGLTSLDARIIQMANEGPLDAKEVAKEFSTTIERASLLLRDVMARREENNRLGDRIFRGFPTITIGDRYAEIRSVNESALSVKYADILRYILSNPDSSDLDKICPPRMQTVSAESVTIQTNTVNEDALIDEAYADNRAGISVTPRCYGTT